LVWARLGNVLEITYKHKNRLTKPSPIAPAPVPEARDESPARRAGGDALAASTPRNTRAGSVTAGISQSQS
jgi:hypothetical protein